MSNELFVTILVGIAIAIGIVGSFAPIVPGLALVWLAIVSYGVMLGFGTIGWITITVVTVLLVVGIVLGIRIPQQAAARTGLSTSGQLLGLMFAVVGFFVIPLIGAPIGFVAGVWLAKNRETGDPKSAWVSTKATIGSLLRASVFQALCGIGMGLAWALWAVIVLVTDVNPG